MIFPNYILDELEKQVIRRKSMPRAKKTTRKTTTRRSKTTTQDNPFFEAVVKGAKKIFSPPK